MVFVPTVIAGTRRLPIQLSTLEKEHSTYYDQDKMFHKIPRNNNNDINSNNSQSSRVLDVRWGVEGGINERSSQNEK